MLQLIDIDKLVPHPDNPRKDLGDLTELADSIKSNGILQNLTVVPYIGEVTGEPIEGVYRVVIGHRRLGAARIAGLTEAPCVISDMSLSEQVSTMLLENMQRSDLTVYEQAQAFQMLLNFGESTNDIAEKTGFSQTTVRRRVKLLELDQEKFKASAKRGATLLDYAELEKIENIEVRNSVLEKIGTPDFKWALKQAIEKETTDKNMALLIEQLDTFATRIENSSGMRTVKTYNALDHKDFKKPDDAGTVPYYYVASNYGYVFLYVQHIATKEDEAAATRREQFHATKNALAEETQRAYQLRREFVSEITNAKAKKSKNVIIEYLLRSMMESPYELAFDEFVETLSIEFKEDRGGEEWSFEDIADKFATQPDLCLLVATYLSLDGNNEGYFDWNNNHTENELLDLCYAFLEKLGYEMSEKERQLQDGTHELFAAGSEG